MQVGKFGCVQICTYTNVKVREFLKLQEGKYVSMQVFKYASMRSKRRFLALWLELKFLGLKKSFMYTFIGM